MYYHSTTVYSLHEILPISDDLHVVLPWLTLFTCVCSIYESTLTYVHTYSPTPQYVSPMQERCNQRLMYEMCSLVDKKKRPSWGHYTSAQTQFIIAHRALNVAFCSQSPLLIRVVS